MNTPIRILLVEDNKILSKSLSAYLNNREDLVIVGILASSKEVMSALQVKEIDLLVLDIHLPGDVNGLDICHDAIGKFPDLKVMMLSGDTSQELVQGSIEAGALGFVSKEAFMEELVLAIKSVSKGQRYFSSSVSSQILNNIHKLNQKKKEKKDPLTKREKEIMHYVYKEFTNEEIANQLFISPRTVDTHKRNIMKKLKLKNSISMVKYYIDHVKKEHSLKY